MPTCPCCLEDLKPSFLGLGGRHLVGACEVCGDTVCEACLQVALLPAADFRQRPAAAADGGRRVPGRACAGCLWEVLSARGERPDFPRPPGSRRRAAQVDCDHERLVRWMRFCPDCGGALGWQAEPDAPRCDACGAPSHDLFNACWSCGESFEEGNDPRLAREVPGLDHTCSAPGCPGLVAWPMRHCPWCAAEQRWPHTRGAQALGCLGCDTPLDPTWPHCIACGAEAPPPERCVECAEKLEESPCAARCERCLHLVCAACFADYLLPEDEAGELRLCGSCAEALGASPVADEPEEAASTGEDVEDDPEEDDAQEDDSDAGSPEAGAAPAPEPSAWEVLGVRPGTPLPEIRRAYLALVAQYHPDKVAQLGPKLQAVALEETRRLNEAWGALRAATGE